METYTYSAIDDCTSATIVSLTCLENEILASNISSVLNGISREGDDINISFDTELSAGDETTLDSIIASHTGSCQEDDEQNLEESVNSSIVYLDDLLDVDTTGVLNSQVLSYNSSSNKWENSSSSGGGVSEPSDVWDVLSLQETSSDSQSSTTSSSYQTKLSLVVSAYTGVIRVAYTMNVDAGSGGPGSAGIGRLRNTTDSVTIGEAHAGNPETVVNVSGFSYITFSGSSKTFELQYCQTGGTTCYVKNARIEAWRVS